jgi:hypothetical protein
MALSFSRVKMAKALIRIPGRMSRAAVKAMPSRTMKLSSNAAAMCKNLDLGHKKLLISVCVA